MGDQSISLSAFLMIREVASLLPDILDLCLTKAYNTYLARIKLVNDRNAKHIDFLMNCLVELYSLDVKKSCERAVTSVGATEFYSYTGFQNNGKGRTQEDR